MGWTDGAGLSPRANNRAKVLLDGETFSDPFLFSKESWESVAVSPNGEGKDNNGFHKSEMEVIVRQTKKVGVHTLVTMNHLR